MRKIVFIAGVSLLILGTPMLANELDELDIQLVDESDKSALFQKGPIVGCSDHAKKKELTCSKKPEEIILSKLPTSQQLNEVDETSEDELNIIKEQLNTVLKELSALRKEQEADKKTIKELKTLVKALSDSKSKASTPKKMAMVKKTVKKLTKEVKKEHTATRIRKPIKEVEVYNDHVVIEVQNNESLSTYAQVYYNDNTKYYQIYKANKDKINKSLQITIGDYLTIPNATSYKE